MKLFGWLKKKESKDELHDARMESIKKDIESSDQIIAMMKDFTVERRVNPLGGYDGPERRHA